MGPIIFRSLILIAAFFVAQASAQAATVRAVKGKKVLVNITPNEVQKGQVFFVTRGGKRVGILRIEAVKGRAAMAVLGKGSAAQGDSLVARSASQAPAATASTPVAASATSPDRTIIENMKAGRHWGFMAGFSQNSADVQLRDINNNPVGQVSSSGSGFSAKALFDFPMFNYIWFRGMSGIEQFKTSGGSNQCGGGACTIDIMYLTADFWGRIVFPSNSFRFWGGAGFNLLFPVTKKSTALKEASITNTSIFGIGGGFDYMLGPASYIPVQIEYGMYPKSDQVSASAIAIRAGYAFKF